MIAAVFLVCIADDQHSHCAVDFPSIVSYLLLGFIRMPLLLYQEHRMASGDGDGWAHAQQEDCAENGGCHGDQTQAE